jgi:hypothetical protein
MSAENGAEEPLPAEYRRVLDKQQNAVMEAQATLGCIITAIEDYSESSSEKLPLFSFALRVVVAHLEKISTALYEEELTIAAAKPDEEDEEDEDD